MDMVASATISTTIASNNLNGRLNRAKVMAKLAVKDRGLLMNALNDRRTQQVLKSMLPAMYLSQN